MALFRKQTQGKPKRECSDNYIVISCALSAYRAPVCSTDPSRDHATFLLLYQLLLLHVSLEHLSTWSAECSLVYGTVGFLQLYPGAFR